VETTSIVDLVDESRKIIGDVNEGFVGQRMDGLDLERLHEALDLGVVLGIASAPHRTDKTAAKQGVPIGQSGVLRTAIRVVDTTGRRLAALDCGLERGQRQADVDRAADRIADCPTRPGVENDRDVSEAFDDGDIRDVCDPDLVRPVNCQALGAIGMDRLVVVAVCRRHIAAPLARLQVMLAHQPPDLLVIDDHASMPQLGANAPPAIEFEFLADRRDRLDDCSVGLRGRFIVEGRAAIPISRHPSAMLRPGGRQ